MRCCRYYLWVLLCILVGVLTMELPMQAAAYFYLDATWCTFDRAAAWNATIDLMTGD